ncbi:unnamed protein product [Adineta steineri]|uniref:Ionotropic glutamate receptor C-terminal domain-containing protein n=1 Tax=Adineta steineri TaxID=433720 RepID=A0A819PY52_9BILA|nr:unnamed protein product [Adineta steineri]
MARTKHMAHEENIDGQKNVGERAHKARYSWTIIGENVAAGQTTGSSVMNSWMHSKGHRDNILNGKFRNIGLGIAQDANGVTYWCMFNIHSVKASWPSSNSSNIQLLGLFPDAVNTTDPTELSIHSRAMFKAAILLSQQYNITIGGQFIEWQSAQTGGNAIDAISNTCQAMSASNIIGIIGPAFSRETPIIADFAEKIGIPVISYSATDPELSDHKAYPSFYRIVPSDNAAALAIFQLFIRFNWTSCVIIYQNDAFGSDGAKIINEAFIKNNLTISNMVVFDIITLRIRGNLMNILTSSSTRIVLVWASASYTSLIVQEALDSDVVGPYFTWILSSSISLNSFNQTFYSQLIGMLTVQPTTASVVNAPINITLLNAAYDLWKKYEPETFPEPINVNNYALFAFDATWLLIQSLQQLCSVSIINSSLSCISFTNSSFCFQCQFHNSDLFFDTINNMAFLGVSGHVQFIANRTDRINGSYYFAQNAQTSTNGMNFVPVLNYSDYNGWQEYTETSVIIWPGTSLVLPSSNAKLDGITLRIGLVGSIPYTISNIITNQFGQNITNYTGYLPDLISLLQTRLGFIPNIDIPSVNLTRNELMEAVANGVYDILMGDLTVTAARREIVGFSSSIFDTSTIIIMRDTPDVTIDLLSFLKPFSRNLWLLILGAMIFAGILICLFEREENEALKNRSIISLCTMGMWYCFGNLTGCGVDFNVTTAAGRLLTAGLYILSIVLLASYTANLASDLTLLKSKPVISGIDDIKSGKMPYNRLGIITGSSLEDYYLREISNVGESFDEGVFGIVASKQWIYQQDLDVAILSLREEGVIDNLVAKWFQTTNCPATSETSTAMGIDSMGGLFLIFGVFVILSFILFGWTKRLLIKK